MSYRGFKRLLGETSLERKCRLILGGGMFVLILISFIFYERQTEKLVWDQTQLTGQLLVNRTLLARHWPGEKRKLTDSDVVETIFPSGLVPDPLPTEGLRDLLRVLVRVARSTLETGEAATGSSQPAVERPAEGIADSPAKIDKPVVKRSKIQFDIENIDPDDKQQYIARFLRDGAEKKGGALLPLENAPRSEWETAVLPKIRGGNLDSDSLIDRAQNFYRYIGAIRLKQTCLDCHPTVMDRKLGYGEMKIGSTIAFASIAIPLEKTELAINVNRAILLSFAIVTAILAMIFAWVTIRYVMVKPVAHLKEVAEEVAGGNLTVRANIQTGDEFQELSHAFNRMLRTLVATQDEIRKVNTDLDGRLDELARANMALFEMNRLKSEFLATMSHELKTPLNSVLGFSDLLADLQQLEPKQKKWVANIQASGKMLLQMISDILDLAKIEAGKMQVNASDFVLHETIDGVVQLTKPMADKRNISLAVDIDPQIPSLHTDANKLSQILSNLLSNAIKFTPEGGQVKVVCRPDRAHVAISVIDNGVGIAPEDQKLIFEKFRQAESTLTRYHGGTGLGLSIVRELTKLLGGDEVQLESELGRGSTFTVRIPMRFVVQTSLTLNVGDEPAEFANARQNEIRYFPSRDRKVS